MKALALSFVFPILMFLSQAATANQEDVIAFRNVNVVPMTREVILENQTVLIQDGIITAIGEALEINIPTGAAIIEGNGAFLIPGLCDMHTHLYGFEKDPAHLVLYLKHGVTTVRSLNGEENNLLWREQVKQGKLIGPTIYTSGPVLAGLYGTDYGIGTYIKIFHLGIAFLPIFLGALIYLILKKAFKNKHRSLGGKLRTGKSTLIAIAILLMFLGIVASWLKIIPFMAIGKFFILPEYYILENPAQAVNAVRSQNKAGYDLVKMYDAIAEDAYLSAVSGAKRLGIYVTGHCPDQIQLEKIVSSGQDEIAHIDELQSYHWIGYNCTGSDEHGITNREYKFDYNAIERTKNLLVENKTNLVSTLIVKQVMCRLVENQEDVFKGPEYRYVRNEVIEYWKTHGSHVNFGKSYGRYRKEQMHPFLIELTKALHKEGLLMTIGSAVTQEGIVPGYHLPRELEILTEIGLSPYEALEMGTKNAGIVLKQMGKDGNLGTIQVGQKADLILVSGNPLENIKNIRNLVGTMSRGYWHTQEELNQLVDEFLNTY